MLILLAGPATKLFEHLHAVPKVYVADVAWGRETDTGDAGGRVVAEGDPALATPAALDAALPPLLGWQEQIPPSTSNKRVRGERAWVLHHRGEQVELPPSRVYLHAAEWLAHRPGVSRLRLTSSGGYYVRSLARDLGRAVGARAHLVRLHRTAIGPWTDPGRRIRTVTGPAMVPWMRTLLVGPVEVGQAVEGPFVPAAYTLPEGFPAVDTLRLVRDGELVGLASDGVVRVSIGSVCRE